MLHDACRIGVGGDVSYSDSCFAQTLGTKFQAKYLVGKISCARESREYMDGAPRNGYGTSLRVPRFFGQKPSVV